MRFAFTLLLFLGMANIIPAQNAQSILDKFSFETGVKHATVGFSLLDSEGNELASLNKEKSLAPASTQKLVTSITAIEALGYDHKFVTAFIIQGTVNNGVLLGNVIIKSGGDPTLGAEDFKGHYGDFIGDWVSALKEEGITKIDGRVLVDDRIFSGNRHAGSASVDDIGNYYGAGAPGFPFMDNEFTVHFKTGAVGLTSQVISCEPKLAEEVELINTVKAGKVSGDNVIIYSLDGSNQVFLKGELPSYKEDFKVRGAIPNVSEFAKEFIQSKIEEAGIPVKGQELKGPLFINTKELVRTKSPALIEILKVLNKKSVNSYADILLKHIGLAANKKGTFEDGASATEMFWREKGLDTEGLNIEDGSGLSRKNNVTAAFMTALLASVKDDEQVNKMMNNASLSSSVKSMWGGDPKGNIQAKSGYIGRVRAYGGYLLKDGKKYPFYFTINNFHGSTSQIRKDMGRVLRDLKVVL